MYNHHAHPHVGDPANQTTKRLALSLGVTGLFVIFEVIAGLWGNSLALLTDAAHNLTDVIALGLSWYALRLTLRPAHAGKTFGYHRAGILAALVNSTTLVLIALGIFYEAGHRFVSPPEVNTSILIGVGGIAFFINLGTALLIKRGSENDLNLRSSFLHLMGDVLSTLGAVAAGVIIFFTNWNWLDPLVSVLIGLLILWNAWGILRQTVNILLESTPENVEMETMVDDLMKVDGVLGIHDLHVWCISENMRMLTAHIQTQDTAISASANLQNRINDVLLHKYGIRHATLQLECKECKPALLFCNINETHDVHNPFPEAR